MGGAAFWVLPEARKRSIYNLERAFPGADRRWARRTAAASMKRLGEALACAVGLTRLSAGERQAAGRVEGFEHLEGALKRGGAVVVSAHIGCWEYLPAYLATLGRKVCVVAVPQSGSLETGLLRRERRKLDVGEVREGFRSLRAAAALVSSGGMVVCPLDKDTGKRGLSAVLLGRTIGLPSLALRLAAGRGVAVVPAYTVREGGKHVVTFEPAMKIEGVEDIRNAAGRLAEGVERWIKENPEQWPWFGWSGGGGAHV